MDSMEFDKTRKSIRVNDMDSSARRNMLDKFTEAGGKVLKEKSLKDDLDDGSSKNKGSRNRGGSGVDTRLPSELAREKRRQEQGKLNEVRKALEKEEREARSFSNRFMIRLKSRIAGISYFSHNVATPFILSRINLDAKRALMEANIMAHDLFTLNPENGRKIIKALDEKNPLFVELIELGSQLYDRNELNDLTQEYSTTQDVPVPFSAIQIPLYSLIRKLYGMKPYQESYLIAVEQAIDIQQTVEKKQAALYLSKKKKIRGDWQVLMNEIYPGLILLLQRIELMKAEPGSRIFEDLIGFDPTDRPGMRKAGESVGGTEAVAEEVPDESENSNEEDENLDEIQGIEDAEEIPEIAARGLDIMESLTPEDIRMKLGNKGELTRFSIRDKVFLSFLFFRYFEEEYSFILTTAKIKYNATYRDGRKVDMKRTLNDKMEMVRLVYDLYKKYLHENDEFNKALSEGSLTGNYVEYAKRIQLLENRRGGTGRDLRIKIKEFLESLSDPFQMMIDDVAAGKKEIVENFDEPIKFDSPVITGGRLDGKTIEECLREALSFATALAYRIERGDLYGGVIEMSVDEYMSSFPYASIPD